MARREPCSVHSPSGAARPARQQSEVLVWLWGRLLSKQFPILYILFYSITLDASCCLVRQALVWLFGGVSVSWLSVSNGGVACLAFSFWYSQAAGLSQCLCGLDAHEVSFIEALK